VWDRVQELELKIESPVDLKACEEAFEEVLNSIEEMRGLKVKRGFENPPIFFWPAAALYLWAKGVPWQRLLSIIPIDEGDMASLIVRTADHLRQVTNLEGSHPRLASMAYRAIKQILREPVFIE
jgi:superfamily II RNA helicase